MTVLSQALLEVAHARQMIACFRSTPTTVESGFIPLDMKQCRSVRVDDPVSHSNGTCTVLVCLECTFLQRAGVGEPPFSLLVSVRWEAVFPVSYPCAPCTWRFVPGCYSRGRPSHANDHSGSDCATSSDTVRILRPWVVEGVFARLMASQCVGRDDCSLIMWDNAECYSRLHRNPSNLPFAERRAWHSSGAGGAVLYALASRNGDGACASLFLGDLFFVCSWWVAVELDEECLALPFDTGRAWNARALGEDGGERSVRVAGGLQYTEDVSGASMLERPRRDFAAVFLPNGSVAVWSRFHHQSDFEGERDGARLISCIRSVHDQPLQQTVRGCYGEECQGALHDTENGVSSFVPCFQEPRAVLLLHIVNYVRDASDNNVESVVLPSMIVSRNLLSSKGHGVGDICLYAGNPSDSLRINAHLTRGDASLLAVSNAFRVLYSIVKSVTSAPAPPLCARQLIATTLNETLTSLQARGKSFWAGVVACCILLPSITSDRPVLPGLVGCLVDPARCYLCVSVVAHVFSVLGYAVKLREAQLTQKAIWDGHSTLVVNTSWKAFGVNFSAISKSARETEAEISSDQKKMQASPNHQAVTECAVCGLALQRPGQPEDGNSVSSNHLWPSPHINKWNAGIVVQCLRCGHGGHLAHMMAWWKEKTMGCCPKGCKCTCIY
ncbi:hypothetical protein TRVL_03969 [Trypanosoma vivax]|nr:hypothetical protein TRVL_03969 [Trypanosoma vivax]